MKFSVLIPCFNLAPWIGACLDSVRAQTCGDWECVIVDDGSTDGSGEIVAKAVAGDCRFRIVRQANAGVGAARTAALAAARGEWVVFLDGDDVLAPEALTRMVEATAARPEMKAIRFDYVRLDEKGDRFHSDAEWDFGLPICGICRGRDCPNRVKKGMLTSILTRWGPPRPQNASASGDAVRRVADEVVDTSQEVPMKALTSYLWQFAFRRETIGDMRFARYRRGEDRLFLVEALVRRVNGYVELNETLYGYRRREGSAMRTAAERQVLLDELDHRLDVVRLVAESDKRIDFSDPGWYEWIEDFYLNHWRQLRSVRTEWLMRLRELRTLPGFTRWGRLRMRLAVRCPWTLRFLSRLGRRHG